MNNSAKELQKIRKEEKVTHSNGNKRITRRKTNVAENVASRQMQKHFTSIEVVFD